MAIKKTVDRFTHPSLPHQLSAVPTFISAALETIKVITGGRGSVRLSLRITEKSQYERSAGRPAMATLLKSLQDRASDLHGVFTE